MHSAAVYPSYRQAVDNTKNLSVWILHFWKWPGVNIYWFLCQYLTSGVILGLYVHLQDTPNATRPFLVDITPSTFGFGAILVPAVPWDNSEMCVRARSFVTRLLSPTGFLVSDTVCDLCKWTNTVSEADNKLSYVRIGQKLISVDQKVSATIVMGFPTSWLRILRICFITDTWLCWKIFEEY